MPLIKSPDQEYISSAFDPAYFMSRAFGMVPDPWQTKVLREANKRLLLNCSRQAGKSRTVAAYALHRAVFHPRSTILILAVGYRQAIETFRKVREGLDYVRLTSPMLKSNTEAVEFPNKSRIIALPGKGETIRAYAANLIIIDEASQVPDEVYGSVSPMVATTQGDIIALSTPYGQRGWWHKAWTEGLEWERVEVTCEDCPRITKKFIEAARKEFGNLWVEQEYYCKFVDPTGQLFGHDLLMQAVTAEIQAFRPITLGQPSL